MNLNTTHIAVTPHELQRYPTAGDYFDINEVTHIRVSRMNNADYEFLVALHEFVEQHLCKKRGISEECITKFDMEYTGDGEPGDDPAAPYRKEHEQASIVERLVADWLDVDFSAYDTAVRSL